MKKFVMQPAPHPARSLAVRAVHEAPDGYVVTIKEASRNLEQNALMWCLLNDFAEQLEWPVNGVMTRLDAEAWKDLLTAAFSREQQRVSPGLNGGMVLLGLRTSQFGKRQMAEFVDFIYSVGADRGVVFDQAAA